jgi:transcriptional regulator with XRE-family HTH domain
MDSEAEAMHEREAATWRDLLKIILEDAEERQRLSQELGVRVMTLTRWASGESDPRPQNLRHLVDALPQYRQQLLELLGKEHIFTDFPPLESGDTAKGISDTFYARVFRLRATALENMRYWTICTMVIQQALGQLDPERLGMSINVVRCMPPSADDHKIHSLRESIGIGTHPWGGEREQKAMLLGAESLCGYVASLCRPAANQNVDDENNLTPAHKVPHEKSAAVYPILCAGRIAGVLLVSSTQTGFFVSQVRLRLIEQYANMIALAFDEEECYAPEDIQLFVMPDQEIQKPYFATFRQRVTTQLMQAAQQRKPIGNIEAENQVWRQLEHELLQVSLADRRNDVR